MSSHRAPNPDRRYLWVGALAVLLVVGIVIAMVYVFMKNDSATPDDAVGSPTSVSSDAGGRETPTDEPTAGATPPAGAPAEATTEASDASKVVLSAQTGSTDGAYGGDVTIEVTSPDGKTETFSSTEGVAAAEKDFSGELKGFKVVASSPGESRSVTCRISVEGEVVQEKQAEGTDPSATCEVN